MDSHTLLCLKHNQRGPAVQHRELCSLLCGSLDRSQVWGRMDACIFTAESLCCSPETVTTLLTGYTPVQNKQLKKKKERKERKNKEQWENSTSIHSLGQSKGHLL